MALDPGRGRGEGKVGTVGGLVGFPLYIRWPIYPQADANYTELLVASNKNQTELLKTDKGWRAGLRACAKRTHTLNHAVLRIRGDTTTVPAQENHNCLWTNRL